MRKFILSIFIFQLTLNIYAQSQELDWPNLQKYKKDNAKIISSNKNGKRVVLMGNSITESWSYIYPEYFKNKDYINRGISGQTTPQMLVRFRPDVIDLDPDIVVILAGINDIAENTGPSTIKMITDNIISMAEIASTHNINVILSSILPAYNFPWKPKINPHYKILKINEILQEYAIKNNHIYLDYFTAMHDGNNGLIKKYGLDTVHPNIDGYKIMSNMLDRAIDKSFNKAINKNELDKYSEFKLKKRNGKILNYRIRKPSNIKQGEKYPLLFFLHGAGGRGNDNRAQLFDANGIGAFSKNKIFSKYNSYIIVPQVPNDERWVSAQWNDDNHKIKKITQSMEMAFEAMDNLIKKNKSIDKKRIYIMGLSMGGWGTWDAIQRRPNFFAAAVPICGGGDINLANKISNIPIWAYHGKDDDVISAERSREMVLEIKKHSNNIKYTEIKNRNHDSWIDVWNSKKVWDWMYSQKKD